MFNSSVGCGEKGCQIWERGGTEALKGATPRGRERRTGASHCNDD